MNVLADAARLCAGETLRMYSPDGITFVRETSWPPSWTCDVISRIVLDPKITIRTYEL